MEKRATTEVGVDDHHCENQQPQEDQHEHGHQHQMPQEQEQEQEQQYIDSITHDSIELIPDAPPFYKQLHIKYISTLASRLDLQTSYEGALTEHLRVSGVYWSLTAMFILLNNNIETIDHIMNFKTDIVDWVYTCYDPHSGGFGGNTNQDGHLLYTLSAIQVLALAGCIHNKDDHNNNNKDDNDGDGDERLLSIRPNILHFVCGLQKPDGSFAGDRWGEIDTRFTYCALSILSLLGALDSGTSNTTTMVGVDVRKAAQYIMKCRNLDGGFGSVIGAESHAGQVFCCVGALAIAQSLDLLLHPTERDLNNDSNNIDVHNNYVHNNDVHNDNNDIDPCGLLGWWLSERQCDSGGLNGRPEKQADVCYSWWILSVLSIVGKVSWINERSLARFILKCQDDVDGGIADRPDDMPDVFHTFFGISGLSLLGYLHPPPPSNATTATATITATTTTTTPTNDNSGCTGTNFHPNNEKQLSTEKLSSSLSQFCSIDPLYALPTELVQRMKLQGQVIVHRDDIIDSRLCHYDVIYVD